MSRLVQSLPIVYARRLKYELVGDRVRDMSGILVDVGARDRILERYLESRDLRYLSADVSKGHDLLWNLEKPLDCADLAFDVVVALDVLEHVDRFHAAFDELLRVTRAKLIVSLPNMTNLAFRLRFLWRGHLGGKYSLLPEPQADRHRWLTHYDDVRAFMLDRAQSPGISIRQFNILWGYTRLEKLVSRLPLPAGLRTYSMMFEVTREPDG